jgi:hypothetical protein
MRAPDFSEILWFNAHCLLDCRVQLGDPYLALTLTTPMAVVTGVVSSTGQNSKLRSNFRASLQELFQIFRLHELLDRDGLLELVLCAPQQDERSGYLFRYALQLKHVPVIGIISRLSRLSEVVRHTA